MSAIVPGVVLAAGQSKRMGRTKALLPTGPDGETFVSRILRVLRDGGVDDVLVVLSEESAHVADAVARDAIPPRVVVNRSPEGGQISSLQAALRVIDRPGVAGMLVTLVDVPLVSASTVRLLLDAYREAHPPIVRPVQGGRHGHPVIFDRSVFDELRQAEEGQGAKTVVRAHANESVEVPIEEDGPFRDIDTPQDYAEAFGRSVPDAGTGEDRGSVDRPR